MNLGIQTYTHGILEASMILNKLQRTIETLKIIKLFIRAERTGDWYGPLAATHRMVNLYMLLLCISIMRKMPGYIFR